MSKQDNLLIQIMPILQFNIYYYDFEPNDKISDYFCPLNPLFLHTLQLLLSP